MIDFFIKKLSYDLSSNAGLAFIGKYLQLINITSLVDKLFPVRSGTSNSDILKCFIGCNRLDPQGEFVLPVFKASGVAIYLCSS